MNAQLLSCGKLEIPEALKHDHSVLAAELIRAISEPGQIGIAAERVAQLCLPHFAEEEESVSRATGLLHDLATDRERAGMATMAPIIARFSAQHIAMRDQHQPITAALEALLQEARKEENMAIVGLVYKIKYHEKIENQVMYPTLLFVDRSVKQSLKAGRYLNR
jgi:predicted hydrolase (HD superfamily)